MALNEYAKNNIKFIKEMFGVKQRTNTVLSSRFWFVPVLVVGHWGLGVGGVSPTSNQESLGRKKQHTVT